jgi:hypothetical protein
MVLRVLPSNPLPGGSRRSTPRRWRQPDLGHGGGGGAGGPPDGLAWLRRLAWFVALWLVSVAALAIVSLAIKLAIGS